MNRKLATSLIVLIFTLCTLILIYIYRINGDLVSRVPWYSPLILYGLVITPFLMMKFSFAHMYRPLPDLGYRPKVSVIIPAFQEEKMIASTIGAILRNDYPSDRLELIVVDDGSEDKTYDNAMTMKQHIEGTKGIYNNDNLVVLKLQRNYGKRFAFARGFQICSGEIVICVDSDSLLSEDAIKNLVQPFINSCVYCVCGHGEVLNKNKNILTKLQRVWYASCFRIGKALESSLGMVTCCSGLLAAYRKKAIQTVIDDWLGEKFLGKKVTCSDDRRLTNLMLRFIYDSPADDRTLTNVSMKEKYTKSMYQSNAVAYTVVPETMRTFVKQQLRWGRGSLRGMLFGASFFWKRPLRQALIFYLMIFTTFLTPFLFLFNAIIFPVIGGWYFSFLYFGGLVLVNFVQAINLKQLVPRISYKDLIYRIFCVGLTVIVTTVYLYAWFTVWEGKRWYTRDDSRKSLLSPPTVVH